MLFDTTRAVARRKNENVLFDELARMPPADEPMIVPVAGVEQVLAALDRMSLRLSTTEWQPVFDGVEIAVLWGELDRPGSQYVLRAKHQDGVKVPPHWHSFDECITVISGTWVMGLGDAFD